MNAVAIKKVTIYDLNELKKISKQTFLETYAAKNTEGDMMKYLNEAFATKKLKAELSDSNSEFYFGILEDQIIGYLKVNSGYSQTDLKDEKSLEIQRIYVLEAFQGMKIGKALYQKAVEIAKKKELDYLWLGVWEENPKAIQFYEKIGFEAFDKHVFQFGNDSQTDIMMKLELK